MGRNYEADKDEERMYAAASIYDPDGPTCECGAAAWDRSLVLGPPIQFSARCCNCGVVTTCKQQSGSPKKLPPPSPPPTPYHDPWGNY